MEGILHLKEASIKPNIKETLRNINYVEHEKGQIWYIIEMNKCLSELIFYNKNLKTKLKKNIIIKLMQNMILKTNLKT